MTNTYYSQPHHTQNSGMIFHHEQVTKGLEKKSINSLANQNVNFITLISFKLTLPDLCMAEFVKKCF